MKTLTLTVGLPRSGKSSWSRTTGWPIVSPDAIRLALYGLPFIARAEPMVWVMAKLMVAALFEAGHENVILDSCSVTRAHREEWRDLRWDRRFVCFDASVEICKQRAIESGQVYLLEVIDRMVGEFEPVEQEEQGPREHFVF